jgi:hypothetical protein
MRRTDLTSTLSIVTYKLQFNVTRKIEKFLEIWSLQIVRKGIWPCPLLPRCISMSFIVGRLLILIQCGKFELCNRDIESAIYQNLLLNFIKSI